MVMEGDRKVLRCGCHNKVISTAWGSSEFERHFGQKVHVKFEEKRAANAVEQKHMDDFAEREMQEEEERLENEGTRRRDDVTVDEPYRKRTTAAFVKAGLPLHKINEMRDYLEEESKRSLGHPSHLAAKYIGKLLKGEIELQKSELQLVKYMSIIFDATPRQGDFFALICRRVCLNAELKRAAARQTLIHCSALKGSLNGDTLAREVTTGLANRGKTLSDVVAAMNDGCYTNGKAHDSINEASGMADIMQTFVSLCLSHCASNAGEKATSVTLEYFWTLVQKVVASSDVAKVSRN